MHKEERLLFIRRGEYVKTWSFRRWDWMGWRVGASRYWHDPGQVGPPSFRARELTAMPKMGNAPDKSGVKMIGASLGPWGKAYPLLCDWLCAASWDDGTPLGKTRLSLSRAGQEIVACLQIADHNGARVESRAADPLTAIVELEQLLALPLVPWQQDQYPIGQTGRQKKK